MSKAVVTTVTVSPHPDPEVHSLAVANALGLTFIVSKTAQTGDVYLVFPTDTILEDNFCKKHNLYPTYSEDGTRTGGYFTEGNARVRAQSFRGVKSYAFGMLLQDVFPDPNKRPAIGEEIDTINGEKICGKYYSPATLKAMKDSTPKTSTRKIDFPEHYQTPQLGYVNPEVGDYIVITLKLHGTSCRVRHDKVNSGLSCFQRSVEKVVSKIPYLNVDFSKDEYLLGTRRVLLSESSAEKSYYAADNPGSRFPYDVALKECMGKLPVGYQVYGELVGFGSPHKPLFTHDTSRDKETMKRYGKTMHYTYGQPEGTAAFYVYRVTYHDVELSWPQIEHFCETRGLKTVPVLDKFVFTTKEDLLERAERLGQGPDVLDDRHIREGVCALIHSKHGIKHYKHKSGLFKLLEGLAKDDDNYVDAEEIA